VQLHKWTTWDLGLLCTECGKTTFSIAETLHGECPAEPEPETKEQARARKRAARLGSAS
jgi:hypothetical protein